MPTTIKEYALIIFDWYGTLMDKGHLFSGVPALLTALKEDGYILAIASSMNLQPIKDLLDKYHISTHFNHIQTQDLGYPKPDPRMLENVLSATGFTADQALMIGDSPVDFHMAQMANVDCVGIGDNPAYADEYELKAVLTHVTQLIHFLQ